MMIIFDIFNISSIIESFNRSILIRPFQTLPASKILFFYPFFRYCKGGIIRENPVPLNVFEAFSPLEIQE
jgi:hypothetical protein